MESDVIKGWIKGIFFGGIALFLFFCLFSYNLYDPTFSFCQLGVPVSDNPSNFGGKFGSYLSGLLVFLFGKSSYFLVLLFFLFGLVSFGGEKVKLWVEFLLTVGLLVIFSSFFSLTLKTTNYPVGGIIGLVVGNILKNFFGERGVFFILTLLGICCVGFGIHIFLLPLKGYIGKISFRKSTEERKWEVMTPSKKKKKVIRTHIRKTKPAKTTEIVRRIKRKPSVATETSSTALSYQLPPIEILKVGKPTTKETKEDMERCAQVIEETLSDFGIEGEVVQINQGPRVTMYELQLAPGIPVQKVHKIADNIAMSLKVTSVRIVAPIPGKSTVGIEVPNREISIVYLREIISSKEFERSPSKLTLGIGKDIMGRPVIADLKIMPHLLIAGATGSGKTVCLNSLITSILYKANPDEVKFLLIDPKMVELTLYNDLPHLILPVVVEIKKAVVALKWLIREMERRYKIFSQEKVRNIESFNTLYKDAKLPYIVVVIDELADLMMIARNEIENSIIRLSQLSRAAGIHLILATQRPSVNVITGVIKANLPCRISFQVTSKFDSRTIIDTVGAEKLLGRGDLLFIPPGSSRPIRIQGSFISDREIEEICEFWRKQKEPEYQMEILEQKEETYIGGISGEDDDELYQQAKRIVLDTKIASISMLQRRLKIGFNRAARLIERMEEEGIVGPYREGKPRQVIINKFEDEPDSPGTS
ncbi:MAG TPA: DNA translocase FtsK [Firmicutes bacterium]|nr:DNA translocase FtsK [Bacillota bacterium]